MPRRDVLKANLFEAWQNCIAEDYVKHRRINSERSLQASFWARLNKVLPDSRHMFIEPAIRADGKIYIPDLIIYNSKKVIGVVELKYAPRVKARTGKDKRTIRELANCQGELFVSNNRFRGRLTRIKTYHFSEHVVFAWAGVYRASNENVAEQFACLDVRQHSLMQLHAMTQHDGDPEVFRTPTHQR